MADDPRLSCGRTIDDTWDHIDQPADPHQLACPYCQQARRQLQQLSRATADLRHSDTTDPALQPTPSLLESVMGLVRAEVRRGQSLPLLPDQAAGATISEQAVVALVWTASDTIPGVRARRCRVHPGPGNAPGPAVVDIDLTLATTIGVDLPATAQQLRSRVTDLLRAEAGLQTGRINITVEDTL